MKIDYTQTQYPAKHPPKFDTGETNLLVREGWQRHGNHSSGLTDWWSHPQHKSEKTGERLRLTREEALRRLGANRADRVKHF